MERDWDRKIRSAWLMALLLACCSAAAWGMDQGYREGVTESATWENVRLVWETAPWGKALMGFSGMILIVIVFCTANAGNAFRAGARAAFSKLPARTDPEGLTEIRDLPESGPMHRALKVGLVTGRGGLLISKSAVLAAWEAERTRFRHWPRVLVALGVLSLAMGLLSASQRVPIALDAWMNYQQLRVFDALKKQYDALNQAHALLNWGLTNCFVALLLFFVFDRVTQMMLDRSTLALVRYLGDAGEAEGAGFPKSPAEAVKAEQGGG